VPWPVEINPRYTASVEVLEYATGLTALGLHGQVFDSNLISQPSGDPIATGIVIGKSILFAPTDLVFPAGGPWLAAGATTRPVQELPAFADLPAARQPIRMGHPVLTFFARADSPADCCQALRQIASDLDRRLFAR
jgi:predicted ATP-grasp superfamily ATP-dependent carboligase